MTDSSAAELRYAATHEWLRLEEDGSCTVGISEHAQQALGDVVYVELPEVGREYACGDEVGVIESVKAAAEIYAPISGRIVACNELLESMPEQVNEAPYAGGWLFQLEPVGDDLLEEVESLLDEDAYQRSCADTD